jgi:ferredoxin--NADP+ reductase
MTKLRLAIIGAGPSGIYASDILVKAERTFDVSIDLFDRLPAPYGLVRYGVAPDHPRIKGVVNSLRGILDRGGIRIFGNVNYGTDITLEDLRRHYNAVIFATGAMHSADLAIPGIGLNGSYGSADFVSWYDGHPDAPRDWPLDATAAAVIGNGNVALDVARILAKPAEDMLSTDVPDNVYRGLEASPITDVHIFGRRGPMQVKFTPLELRELGELRDLQMMLADEDFDYDEASKAAISGNKQVMVIDRILQSWRAREPAPARRRIHLHFFARPVELVDDGDGRVGAFRYERTHPDGQGGVRGTGEILEVAVQAVYRAVGFFGAALPGIPFDRARGVIPNREGQVLRLGEGQAEESGRDPMPGVFTTGWIKRGPQGLIGRTKSDAMETIATLIAAEGDWWAPSSPEESAVPQLLEERGIRYTELDGWHRLDAHEIALGAAHGRTRIKVVPREDMVRISRGE